MRRRLDLAASLMHEPDLLVLDEPTTGLDPGSRQQLWAILTELKAAGTTMLLTTQYLEEADRFADIVHVLHHGKIPSPWPSPSASPCFPPGSRC
jgi:ABC-2 type transport system ATP-binding protein